MSMDIMSSLDLKIQGDVYAYYMQNIILKEEIT